MEACQDARFNSARACPGDPGLRVCTVCCPAKLMTDPLFLDRPLSAPYRARLGPRPPGPRSSTDLDRSRISSERLRASNAPSSDIVRAINRKSRLVLMRRSSTPAGWRRSHPTPGPRRGTAHSRSAPSLRPYRCEYVCKGLARCEVAGPPGRPVPSALSPLRGCHGGHDLTEVGSDRGL